MKIAVVGATGLVGRTMIKLLDRLEFSQFIPVASERSAGSEIIFRGKKHKVLTVDQAISKAPDIAIFSAGGEVSRQYAPLFAKVGTTVIDNSSAWRMEKDIKLIVPEINGDALTKDDKIIANPNCSTIQLVMVLGPLHKEFGIDSVIISTYQSVTGSGQKAVSQLKNEREGKSTHSMVYPHPIDLNCIPHCDVFLENGYTKEEMKLVNETRKILGDQDIKLSATAVRVPVEGGHSESVHLQFKNDIKMEDLRKIISNSEGVVLYDDPGKNIYPTPRYANDKDEVYVGRLRADLDNSKAVNLWIVADNLRKGAATNAIQIASLVQTKFLK